MFFTSYRSHGTLSLLTSYLSVCFILKRFVLLCMTSPLILRLGIFVASLPIQVMSHTYNTRFSDTGNFYVNKSRLSVRLNSFSALGAKVWNCLKLDLHKLRKRLFKYKIHQFLLAVLDDEDDYVDISSLKWYYDQNFASPFLFSF